MSAHTKFHDLFWTLAASDPELEIPPLSYVLEVVQGSRGIDVHDAAEVVFQICGSLEGSDYERALRRRLGAIVLGWNISGGKERKGATIQ